MTLKCALQSLHTRVRSANFTCVASSLIIPAHRVHVVVHARRISKPETFRLRRYPCIVTGAEEVVLSGHVGEGRSVCFSFDDTYVLSVSAGDRCVLQWRVSSEGDMGFDELDQTALDGLQDFGENKKDAGEQTRLDKRNAMIEAQRVPMMDPGKFVPPKEGKGKGKEAERGTDGKVTEEEKEKKTLENPGQPEHLPEVTDP